MTDEEQQLASQLVQQLAATWPQWSARLREQEQRFATHEIVELSIPVPSQRDHALRFAIRGPREIEVHYDDSQEPGPAEKLFVWGEGDPAADGVGAVVEFTKLLVRGEVVVVREQMAWWARLLRRKEADSTLRFVDRETAARQAARWQCVYTWKSA